MRKIYVLNNHFKVENDYKYYKIISEPTIFLCIK